MQCDEAVEAVASLASAHQPTDAVQAVHVSICLRCQAAVARDRRLIRELRVLRDERISPDPTLFANVLGAVDAEAASIKSDRNRRFAYVGGAAATAGGIVIAIAAKRVLTGHSNGRPNPLGGYRDDDPAKRVRSAVAMAG